VKPVLKPVCTVNACVLLHWDAAYRREGVTESSGADALLLWFRAHAASLRRDHLLSCSPGSWCNGWFALICEKFEYGLRHFVWKWQITKSFPVCTVTCSVLKENCGEVAFVLTGMVWLVELFTASWLLSFIVYHRLHENKNRAVEYLQFVHLGRIDLHDVALVTKIIILFSQQNWFETSYKQ